MTYDPTMRSKPHVERREREARRRRDTFEKIFEGEAGGDDIAKARTRHDVGGRGLAAAVSEHVLDMINFHRRRLGIAKGGGQLEESSMRTSETLENIMKDGSIAGVCAAIVAKGVTTLSQDEIVEAVGKIAVERYVGLSEAQAFAKIYSDGGAEGRVLRQAINVAKSMPYIADLTPLQVGGFAAQNEANDSTESSEAYAQLQQIGRDRWPTESEAKQFSNAISDPANIKLAAKAHRRPSATTSYPFPV